ncbi:MAG: hypothetical protein HQL96_14805 [Magnetococcales bacterium]|nr:hypothetical protein [Magnetococcales bacterium]
MPIVRQNDIPFPASERELGIAIRSIDEGQNHVGIVYSLNDTARLCHLAWHHKLLDEPLAGEYYWGAIGLHEHVQSQIAGYIALLKQNQRVVPYGFSYDKPPFDDRGRYQAMAIGKGLTCATFVMAVFERQGCPLLIKDNWPDRPEDKVWMERILTLLQRHAESEHLEAVKNDMDASRFRPEEVVAGAISENPPIPFSSVSSLAHAILAALNASE